MVMRTSPSSSRVRRGRHVVDLDARLPLGQRVADGLGDEPEQVGRDRLEEQIPDPAAELRAHHPLARRGQQHDLDRVVDVSDVVSVSRIDPV